MKQIKKEDAKKFLYNPGLYIFYYLLSLTGIREFEEKESSPKEVNPKCTVCGGEMSYKKKDGKIPISLKCNKCGFERNLNNEMLEQKNLIQAFDIKAQDQGLYTHPYKWISPKYALGGGGNCDAELVIQSQELIDKPFDPKKPPKCPFCAQPLTQAIAEQNTDKPWGKKNIEESMLSPKRIIPFMIPKKQVEDSFRSWIKDSNWFRPSALFQVDVCDDISGVYVPYFWLKSANTKATWSVAYDKGQGGKGGKGNKPNYELSGGYLEKVYKDMLFSASSGVSADLLNQIGPIDTKYLVDFDTEYLEGWIYELNQRDVKKALGKWQERINKDLESEIKKRAYGKKIEELLLRVYVEKMDVMHVLVPVWVGRYSYGGKSYQYVVNGYDGKASGRKPYSDFRIRLFVAFVTLCIVAMVLLADLFMHG